MLTCKNCGEEIRWNGIHPPCHEAGGYRLCIVDGERPGTYAEVQR